MKKIDTEKQLEQPLTYPKVGLALGSGGARGWAHIGVIHQLESWGIEPSAISGCSIGALVGGALAAKKLYCLESWATSLRRKNIALFFDLSLESSGGPIKGQRLLRLFKQMGLGVQIEEMPLKFSAVATDLKTGKEVLMNSGPFLTALRASASLPGCLAPISWHDTWLVDGGVVNPVPTRPCRDLGADYVISVDLNRGLIDSANWSALGSNNKGYVKAYLSIRDRLPVSFCEVLDEIVDLDDSQLNLKPPTYVQVLNSILSIMQDQITQFRAEKDPADITISPHVQSIKTFDFHKASEAILIGMESVRPHRDQIIDELNTLGYRFKTKSLSSKLKP